MNNLKLKLVAIFMVSGLVFTSCEDSNLVEVTDAAEVVNVISDEEAIALVESEDISMPEIPIEQLRNDEHIPFGDKLIEKMNHYKGTFVRAPKM